MPTIKRLPTCAITLYAGDHLPPHFHVRLQDGREALVEIANLSVLSGRISRRELAAALAWAAENQALPRACEKTPTYCGRLQTSAAALRYVKIGVI